MRTFNINFITTPLHGGEKVAEKYSAVFSETL